MSRRPRVRRGGALTPVRRLSVMAMGALAVLASVALILGLWAVWTVEGPGPAARVGRQTVVILRQGAGVSEIAATLEEAHVIGSAPLFMAAAQLSGAARKLKAGEYAFRSRVSMADVLGALKGGRVLHHYVTIAEGLSSDQVMDVLMKADFLTGAAPAPPEGSVLPETYEVRRGDDRAAVLQRMMDARDRLLASLWDHRRADLPYQSPDQAVTVASIVEKETAKADERPRIAAVFVNRLDKGMRLESDPTVIYGLTHGHPLGHGLRASELASQTPYNTYLVAGLPPTPIGNPGRASLAAALDPPRTEDLYFVADGSGGHVFAATLEAHQKNVLHWRAVEQAAKAAAVH